METRSFGERVDEKSAQALLANRLRKRYDYNPAMAEAISKALTAGGLVLCLAIWVSCWRFCAKRASEKTRRREWLAELSGKDGQDGD